jgi:hypothetical protein
MIVSVHQPQYIPWLGYFDKMARSDAFVFLDNVQYKEREFQNRNKIRCSRGAIWLTVPVVSKGKGRQLISDVRIDNTLSWPGDHLKSMRAAYGKAGYFDAHFPFFENLYAKQWECLVHLNVAIIEYMMKELAITTPVHYESKLGIAGTKTDRIIDICAKLGADTYLSGAGGREYLEEEKFKDSGVKLAYQEYAHPVYRQQFMKSEKDFLPYMSALDLLFNEGPGSRAILGL